MVSLRGRGVVVHNKNRRAGWKVSPEVQCVALVRSIGKEKRGGHRGDELCTMQEEFNHKPLTPASRARPSGWRHSRAAGRNIPCRRTVRLIPPLDFGLATRADYDKQRD